MYVTENIAICYSLNMFNKSQIVQAKNYSLQLHCHLLHPNQPIEMEQGGFDAAVMSGCFAPGHLNPDHMQGIAGLVKSGGKVIFAINDKFFRDSALWSEKWDWEYDLGATIKGLESKGVWKLVEHEIKDGYFFSLKAKGIPGRYFVYEVL